MFFFYLLAIFSQSIVRDFAARSAEIIQEAMKWAPNTTRSHLEDYLSNHQHCISGLIQHSGLSLAAESIIRYSGVNSISSSISTTTLDRWPNCVKNICSEFVATMSLRSHYIGEVDGMISIGQDPEEIINNLLAKFNVTCQEKDVTGHRDCAYKIAAMLIATRDSDRRLIHSLAWAPVYFFSHETIDCIISCWKWSLSARPDLELQVRTINPINFFSSKNFTYTNLSIYC